MRTNLYYSNINNKIKVVALVFRQKKYILKTKVSNKEIKYIYKSALAEFKDIEEERRANIKGTIRGIATSIWVGD